MLHTFTILTTEANAEMRAVHDRMPVVLEPAVWPGWLDEDAGDLKFAKRPERDGTLRLRPVSRDVNSPRNSLPDLMEPISLPDAPRDEEGRPDETMRP